MDMYTKTLNAFKLISTSLVTCTNLNHLGTDREPPIYVNPCHFLIELYLIKVEYLNIKSSYFETSQKCMKQNSHVQVYEIDSFFYVFVYEQICVKAN